LGIIKGWESHWYGGKNYADKLIEDEKIRDYINHRITKGGISKIVIERAAKRIIVTIHTARPGVVIGKGGAEVEKLKEEIKKFSKKDVQINIYEVKKPEIDAQLIGQQIAQQIEARISYRRAMKTAMQAALRSGAEGIRICCSGRLGGAEMARLEEYKEGRIPLQTLRADIDYALTEAQTIYGIIGIKVWVFRGEIFGKVDLSPETQQRGSSKVATNVGDGIGGGGGDRRGGGKDRNRGAANRGGGKDRNRGGGKDRNRGGGK
jgi:small subunit ribosomal protein S3